MKDAKSIMKNPAGELKIPKKPTYEELEQKIAELESDIQKYKASESASKGEEKPGLGDVFLDLIDVMDIAMWELDMDYRVVSSNRKAKEIYGEESVGSFCYFAASGENAVCSDCPAKMVYDGHVSGRSERCRTTASGKTIYIDHIATPIRDKTWNLTGMLVLIIDITERKLMEEEIRRHRDRLDELVRARTRELLKSEKALREKEQKYRALFENTNDAVFFIGPDNNIYLDVNQRAADILGYDIEELIGMSVQNVVASREYDNACRRITALLAGRTLPIYERTFRKKDGSEFPAEVNVAMIYDTQGNPMHIQSVMRDITERKQAEVQIKASLREKEVLLKEIHHRVKNNLAIVSSLLSFQAEITPDKQVRAAFQESRNRIRAMARIHEHLYQSPDLAQIDMAQYVRGVVNQLRRSFGTGAITFRVEIADVILDIDSAMPCGLIINELASNAFKYAFPPGWHKPENGPNQVRVGMYSDDDGQCVLKVSDNGVGLPADLQIENVKRESLGLRLVNILCEQLEGTLQVYSKGGAAFCLTFPSSDLSEDKKAGF